MNIDIDIALVEIGMIENYAPDTSTYEAMVATWRDSNIAIPSKADLQTAYDAWKPMDDWKDKMFGTDSGMPRYLEDHIKDDHDGVASNEFLQVRYDAKIKLRGERP